MCIRHSRRGLFPLLRRQFSDIAASPRALYAPPVKVEELFAAADGNKFQSLNSPVAGARFEAELPRGDKSFQLYSLATPNGQKAGIMLEELGAPYDAHSKHDFATALSSAPHGMYHLTHIAFA